MREEGSCVRADVGLKQAMEMILLGDPVNAERAAELGLVTGLYEPGAVLDAAVGLAKRISDQSSSAVGLAKEAVCRGELAPSLSLLPSSLSGHDPK